MAKWGVNRNIVPGHWRGTKGGKQVRNPGYDLTENTYWTTRWQKAAVARLQRELRRPEKPIKRREKRGQSKPR